MRFSKLYIILMRDMLQSDILKRVILLIAILPLCKCHSAKCHFPKNHSVECYFDVWHSAECHSTEGRATFEKLLILNNKLVRFTNKIMTWEAYTK